MERKRTGRSRSLLSWILFAVSAALFITVGVLYYRDSNKDEQIPTPPSVPGRNEAINIKQALEAQGLTVSFPTNGGGARAEAFSQPGQLLMVDGKPLYYFLYPSVDARENDTTGLEASSLLLINIAGTPIAQGVPHLVSGSNVAAVLMGGDDALNQKVDAAIQGLP